MTLLKVVRVGLFQKGQFWRLFPLRQLLVQARCAWEALSQSDPLLRGKVIESLVQRLTITLKGQVFLRDVEHYFKRLIVRQPATPRHPVEQRFCFRCWLQLESVGFQDLHGQLSVW